MHRSTRYGCKMTAVEEIGFSETLPEQECFESTQGSTLFLLDFCKTVVQHVLRKFVAGYEPSVRRMKMLSDLTSQDWYF